MSLSTRGRLPTGVDPPLLWALSHLDPVLRNVRHVRCQLHGLNEAALPFLPLILGDSLVGVDIIMKKLSFPVIWHLRMMCPDLRTLAIRGSDACESAFANFGGLILGLKNLQELSYSSSCTQEVWKTLSLLSMVPRLYSLQLSVFNNSDSESIPAPTDTFCFSSLVSLELSFPNAQTIVDAFFSTSFPRLTSITVNVMSSKPISADKIAKLCDVLSGACSASTLERVSICTWELWDGSWELYRVISPCHLHSLLSLNKLTHLSLSTSWLYDLDDQFIGEVFSAIPQLISLSLGRPDRCRNPELIKGRPRNPCLGFYC